MFKQFIFMVLFIFLGLTFFNVVSAANMVVNPGESIQSAIDGAFDGDNVLVNHGVYSGNLYFVNKKNVSLTANGDVTLKPKDSKNPVIYIDTSSSGINIEGFTFQGMLKQGIQLQQTSGCTISRNTFKYGLEGQDAKIAVYLVYSNHNTVSKNTIYHSFNGIGFDNAKYNLISGNYITGTHDAFEIHANSNYNIIQGNTATKNDNCVEIEYSKYNKIIKNNFNNNRGEGVDPNEGMAFQIGVHGDYNYIAENIMKNNKNIGINIYKSFGNHFFKNTITGSYNGLSLNSCSENRIEKCILSNIYNDIYIIGTSNNQLIKTTFDETKIYFNDPGFLKVTHEIQVKVQDKNKKPINGAKVTIKDRNGKILLNKKTDLNGFAKVTITHTITAKTKFAPYTITAKKGSIIKSVQNSITQRAAGYPKGPITLTL